MKNLALREWDCPQCETRRKLAEVGEDVTIKTREIRKGFIYEINILERKWTSCLRKKRI